MHARQQFHSALKTEAIYCLCQRKREIAATEFAHLNWPTLIV
jgi:hypothetical protein